MSLSAESKKRAQGDETPISPPPLKRRAQSSITKGALNSFFTPTSQKPEDRTTWTERGSDDDTPPTLLVGKFVPEGNDGTSPESRNKIAAFDMDSTLIKTASGKKHGSQSGDWKWWDASVPVQLRKLYNDDGYRVVILTNQGGLTLHPDPKSKPPRSLKERITSFKQKVASVLNDLDIPITVYAATGKDYYRKPRTGMWHEMCADYDLIASEVDLENSLYVGDAGGRILVSATGRGSTIPEDFSCSDRNLAHNLGIRFQTPEEFFLGDPPREFVRDFDLAEFPFSDEDFKSGVEWNSERQDVILFCGSPGAGKSTFFKRYLSPLGYERVNQDALGSKAACLKRAKELLQKRHSPVIDATNPDFETRARWVEVANQFDVPIRCVWFKTSRHVCEHNDAVRALNKSLNPEKRQFLPKLAFNSFASRFKEPTVKEGFSEIIEVDFKFRGAQDEYKIWGRYWI